MKNDRTNIESDSFALFSDDPFAPMVDNSNDSSDCQKIEVQDVSEEKRSGSHTVDEEPKRVEPIHEKGIIRPKRGFRAIQNIENDSCSKDTSLHKERCGDKESSVGDRSSGNTEKGSSGTVKGQGKRIGRSKQKVQKVEGGDGTGKDNTTDREIVDHDKYPLSEFEESNRVVSKKITGVPRKTEDPFIVEVIIDGYRYKVSSGSIKGDTYVQGLDSRFILKKLKTK